MSCVVGDLVLPKLRLYQLKSLAEKLNEKLGPRYYGPFVIEERTVIIAYPLKLPEEARNHPVFHILQLKAFRCGTPVVQPLPPQPLPLQLVEELEHLVRPSSSTISRGQPS